MAKVAKHLEPHQGRAHGCGMPLQAMLLLVMPHQEGKHRVMTKELQVGETDGMKHPKQREVSEVNLLVYIQVSHFLVADDLEFDRGCCPC